MKVRQLNRQPVIETHIEVSESGKRVINKTAITDIKSVSYFEKVLGYSKKEE